MDGVLVDTEPLYIIMNKDFLQQHNAVITDEEYNQFIGISAKKMWYFLQEKYNLPFSVDELISMEKQAKYTILNESELQPIDGIVHYFNEQPENCVVVEDAKNGVLAAKAANMFCIGFQNKNSGNQDLSKADLIIHSIKEISTSLLFSN